MKPRLVSFRGTQTCPYVCVCVCVSVLLCTRVGVYMCVQLCVHMIVSVCVLCVGAKMICVCAGTLEEQLLIN